MENIIRVGFFRELPYGDSDGPSLANLGHAQSENLTKRIVEYLGSGVATAVAPGPSFDKLSKEKKIIGSLAILTDGRYTWPSDLAYYFRMYGVVIPQDFVDHMQSVNWTVNRSGIVVGSKS